jgi:DNA-binding response OmpR family regulator
MIMAKKTTAKKPKKKIMLVDDNPDLVYSIKMGLESVTSDYDIIGANGGKECLEMLKKHTPDLILLDIMMPGMDGWDVCAKIKSSKKTESIPIAFLTAKTDPISKGIGRFASADYIEKPVEIKDLKKRIEAILSKKK